MGGSVSSQLCCVSMRGNDASSGRLPCDQGGPEAHTWARFTRLVAGIMA